MKNVLAVTGLSLALAGVGVAAFQDEIRDQQASSVESVAQDAMDKGKEIWDGGRRLRKDAVTTTYMGLGALGFVLGLSGLVKNENKALGLSAMAAGAAAAFWHMLV